MTPLTAGSARADRIRNMLWILFGVAIAFNLLQLAISWDKPILGAYAFRQTQTAISAYWVAKGAPWLAYWTPVLGKPWSIPFEFPLYQWLVACVAALFPAVLTLDQAGRLVSELLFLACLWPAWRIASRCRDGLYIFLVCSIVVLFSPLYVFWSRSFMMESTVLFFSMWFVAAVGDFLDDPSGSGFVEMALVAVLAACIKITTFVGFSFAGAALVVAAFMSSNSVPVWRRPLVRYALVALSVILSIAALLAWLHFSDALKTQSVLGASMQAGSPGMRVWNFGTLAQRESAEIWRIAWVRGPNEALGSWIIAILVGAYAAIRLTWRQRLVVAVLLGLYLCVFFVFTNLHLVHHYYQYANSIFLVAAAGYVLYAGFQRDKRLVLALLLLVCATEIFGFYDRFYNDMMQPNRQLQMMLSTFLREQTPSNEMFVAVGLTWSAEVPYYAERRALMIPDNATTQQLSAISSDLDATTHGPKIGAVVLCPNALQGSAAAQPAYNHLMDALTSGRQPHLVGYCEVYL
jgi:hypothetical protein